MLLLAVDSVDILSLSSLSSLSLSHFLSFSSFGFPPPSPQSEEFSVYMYYTENYMDAVMNLEGIMKDHEAIDYFKVFK